MMEVTTSGSYYANDEARISCTDTYNQLYVATDSVILSQDLLGKSAQVFRLILHPHRRLGSRQLHFACHQRLEVPSDRRS